MIPQREVGRSVNAKKNELPTQLPTSFRKRRRSDTDVSTARHDSRLRRNSWQPLTPLEAQKKFDPLEETPKAKLNSIGNKTEFLKSLYRRSSESESSPESASGSNRAAPASQSQSQHSGKVIGPGIPFSATTTTDVLCGGAGEGSLPTMNPGNLRFATLIDAKLDEFQKSDRKKQLRMAQLSAVLVHEAIPAGRFLIFSEETRLWHAIAPEKAWYKVLRTYMGRRPGRPPIPIEVTVSDEGSDTASNTEESGKPEAASTVAQVPVASPVSPPDPEQQTTQEDEAHSPFKEAVAAQLVEITLKRAQLEQEIARSKEQLEALLSDYKGGNDNAPS